MLLFYRCENSWIVIEIALYKYIIIIIIIIIIIRNRFPFFIIFFFISPKRSATPSCLTCLFFEKKISCSWNSASLNPCVMALGEQVLSFRCLIVQFSYELSSFQHMLVSTFQSLRKDPLAYCSCLCNIRPIRTRKELVLDLTPQVCAYLLDYWAPQL